MRQEDSTSFPVMLPSYMTRSIVTRSASEDLGSASGYNAA